MAAITTSPGHHEEADPNASYLDKKGLMGWLITLDHKRIGVMYLISVILAFALGGVFALLVRAELFTRGKTLMDADTYNRMFSLHGVVMVFFFLVPSIPAVFGNFLVPMMIGAKDLAFPKLNLLSWYLYVIGAAIGTCALTFGGVDTGWTFYAPLSTKYAFGPVALVIVGATVSITNSGLVTPLWVQSGWNARALTVTLPLLT